MTDYVNASRGGSPQKKELGYVRRVKSGKPVTGLICSNEFWKVMVHYRGRSTPCLQDKTKCQLCREGFSSKPLFYLFIVNQDDACCEHLELPENAAWVLEKLIDSPEGFRGHRIVATRHGGKNGKIRFELQMHIEKVAPGYKIPEDQDPSPILNYLWNRNKTNLKIADQGDLPDRQAI